LTAGSHGNSTSRITTKRDSFYTTTAESASMYVCMCAAALLNLHDVHQPSNSASAPFTNAAGAALIRTAARLVLAWLLLIDDQARLCAFLGTCAQSSLWTRPARELAILDVEALARGSRG